MNARLPTVSSGPLSSLTDTPGNGVVSRIVPVPVPVPIIALAALDRVTVMCSSSSAMPSSTTSTGIVAAVSPAAKVSVPDAEA